MSTAPAHALVERPRLQAFVSSLVVTAGALCAACVAMAMLLVAVPLMMAASVTVQGKARRRGWTELEALEG